MRSRLAVAAATLGVGFLPLAPGTWGTLLAWLVLWVTPDPGALAMAAIAVALTAVAVPIASAAERALGGHDPGAIVIDEAVGMTIAVVALPRSFTAWALAFLAFRVFDIIKPFPARRLERLPGGLGIVADDALAGLYANLVVHAYFLIP